MKILTVISATLETAAMAERLFDLIYHLSGRVQKGSACIVHRNLHSEPIAKLKIAAEVAFEHVDVVLCREDKQNGNNELFQTAARHVAGHYKWPWLWLEPGCVPVDPAWLDKLAALYDEQPKRYLGMHLKANEHIFMARPAVYPAGAIYDIEKLLSTPEGKENPAPYEIASASVVVPRSTNTKAFQFLPVKSEEDFAKVREDALIVVGDGAGMLLEHAFESVVKKPTEKEEMIPDSYWNPTLQNVIRPRVTLEPPTLPPQLTQPNTTLATTKRGPGRPPKSLQTAPVEAKATA